MDKDKKIQTRLINDYLYIRDELNLNVLGVFLQGSQNYGLDYKNSDIDTKAIIIPSFKDIALNKPMVSTTKVLSSNEHIDLKDIRLMNNCYKKQNINFLEILFTKWKYIDPEYEPLYQPMFDNAERIARYDQRAAINCLTGMIYEKLLKLEHISPTAEEKIKKRGFDEKQLHHILRCREFLERYLAEEPYKDCLISRQATQLTQIKLNCPYNLEEARLMANRAYQEADEMKRVYLDTHNLEKDTEIENLMDDVLLSVLRYALKKDLN